MDKLSWDEMTDEELRSINRAVCSVLKNRREFANYKAKSALYIGAKVQFMSAKRGMVIGTVSKIARVNIRVTATTENGRPSSMNWRVSPNLLTRVGA